jgi:hydrogenase assembly chaperone HypC/HupF
MCITVPKRVARVEERDACRQARGYRREVGLDPLDFEVAVGEHVAVHAGHALVGVAKAGARANWSLVDELISALDHAGASTQAGGDLPALAGKPAR